MEVRVWERTDCPYETFPWTLLLRVGWDLCCNAFNIECGSLILECNAYASEALKSEELRSNECDQSIRIRL